MLRHTLGCYRHDSERLLKHAQKPLSRITLADLQNFAQDLVGSGLAPVSRVRILAAVKSLFSFCQRTRCLPANPAAELTLPSYENRLAERILAEDDVGRMLAAETGPRDKTLVRLLYAAGLRVSEACGLRWRKSASSRRRRRDYRLRQERPDPGDTVTSRGVGGLNRPARRGQRRGAGVPFPEDRRGIQRTEPLAIGSVRLCSLPLKHPHSSFI
jgi:integrase